MSLIEILFLALALSIDCSIVSFSQGLIFKSNRIKNSIILACVMGFFQGFMPVIGYIFANLISKYVEPFSEWLVFIIFMILGGKFICEAFKKESDECEKGLHCFGFMCLMTFGIATSIDALAAGVNLNFTNTALLFSAFIIGVASFLMSLVGFWFGNLFKKLPSKYLEIIGGIILCVLAVKALL